MWSSRLVFTRELTFFLDFALYVHEIVAWFSCYDIGSIDFTREKKKGQFQSEGLNLHRFVVILNNGHRCANCITHYCFRSIMNFRFWQRRIYGFSNVNLDLYQLSWFVMFVSIGFFIERFEFLQYLSIYWRKISASFAIQLTNRESKSLEPSTKHHVSIIEKNTTKLIVLNHYQR